jgi:hypothetical protein
MSACLAGVAKPPPVPSPASRKISTGLEIASPEAREEAIGKRPIPPYRIVGVGELGAHDDPVANVALPSDANRAEQAKLR